MVFVRLLLVSVLFAGFLGLAQGALGIGGGGFMPVLYFPDLSALNAELSAHGFGGFSGPLPLWGGGGFGGLLSGPRLGGMGYGGEISVRRGEKTATLSFSAGGFLTERALFAEGNMALGFGLLLGGGSAELELIFRAPSSFEEALATPTSTRLSRGFFALEPYLTLELFLFDWAFLKVQVGYLLALGDGWKAGGFDLGGVPASLSAPVLHFFVNFGGYASLTEETP